MRRRDAARNTLPLHPGLRPGLTAQPPLRGWLISNAELCVKRRSDYLETDLSKTSLRRADLRCHLWALGLALLGYSAGRA